MRVPCPAGRSSPPPDRAPVPRCRTDARSGTRRGSRCRCRLHDARTARHAPRRRHAATASSPGPAPARGTGPPVRRPGHWHRSMDPRHRRGKSPPARCPAHCAGASFQCPVDHSRRRVYPTSPPSGEKGPPPPGSAPSCCWLSDSASGPGKQGGSPCHHTPDVPRRPKALRDPYRSPQPPQQVHPHPGPQTRR